MKLDPKALESVLGGMLGAFEAETVAAYAAFAQTPDAQKALAAVRSGDFDRFYFALQYPVGQVIDGLLASEFPGDAYDARFLFKNSQFVERHILRFIEKYEGTGCGSDKTSSVMRGILRFLKTGQEIAFDYTQEYTYHLPRRVFTEHQATMQFFKALQPLYQGNPEPYLEAILALQLNIRD